VEAPVSAVWLTIILVAVASAAIKAAGPLLLGDRQLGPRATVVVASLAPALLTALVLVDTITAGRRLVVDAVVTTRRSAGSLMGWCRESSPPAPPKPHLRAGLPWHAISLWRHETTSSPWRFRGRGRVFRGRGRPG
jgi:uncharacterized membrane protein